MIKRKVYNIDEVDTTVPPGGIVSISPYCSHPFPANKLEMLAMGIFIEKYIQGYPIHMYSGHTFNHDDVSFRNSNGEQIVINRDYADEPGVSYAVVPYRVASSADRTAFAKNFCHCRQESQHYRLPLSPIHQCRGRCSFHPDSSGIYHRPRPPLRNQFSLKGNYNGNLRHHHHAHHHSRLRHRK